MSGSSRDFFNVRRMAIAGKTGVRYGAAITMVAGTLVLLVFLTGFSTDHWLDYREGEFPALTGYSVSMGLWRSKACVGPKCRSDHGATGWDSVLQNRNWDGTKSVMCISLVLAVNSIVATASIWFLPKLYLVACACILWVLTGIFNAIAVIIFRAEFMDEHEHFSWSHWLAVAAAIFFVIIAILLTLFACCFDWTHEGLPFTGIMGYRAGSDARSTHVSYIDKDSRTQSNTDIRM